MRATFLLLTLGLLALDVLLDQVVFRARVIGTARVLRVALFLVATTLVFDNLLTVLPAYVFDPQRTLGVGLPWAPVEDLVYITGVVFLVAVLDKGLPRRKAAETRSRDRAGLGADPHGSAPSRP